MGDLEAKLKIVVDQLNEMMDVVSWSMSKVAIGVAVIAIMWYSIIYILGKKEELPRAWVRAIIGLASIILAGTLLGLWVYTLEAIPTFSPMGN